MDRKRTVDLDWAEPAEGDRYGSVTATRLGLTVAVLAEQGPGGGWPLLRFHGPDAFVDQLVGEYTHDFEDTDGDRFFHDVPLLQDACEAIYADGRDGRGRIVEGNLTDEEYSRLMAYRDDAGLITLEF